MKTIRYSFVLILFLFLCAQLTFAENFTGSKKVVAYVQPNQGTPYYAFGTFGIDIGKKYVSEAQETETARTKFTFDLTSIPGNATINSVSLDYAIANWGNGSYKFKITQIDDKSSPQDIWLNIGQSTALFSDILYGSDNLNSEALTSMVNSSRGGNLYLGALSQSEMKLDSWANLDLTLSIDYSIPQNSVSLTADNNFTASGGINHGTMIIDGVNQTIPLSGYPVIKTIGQNLTLSANSPQDDNQSYQRIWHSGATNSSNWTRNGEFRWPSQTYSFIVAADDDGKRYVANLRKNYAISRNDQTEFDGTISAGVVTHIVDQNSGNITAPATLTPGSITYNFAGWTDDFTLPNPRTITPDDNETFTALYKYPHHSNNPDAYKNNSQRKFVQTPDGVKHIVYESMGKVWYELSTDGGSSWFIGNGGKPLSSADSKSPSMSFYGNQLGIVWQEKSGVSYKIKLAVFYSSNYSSSVFGTVADEVQDYSHNANPVIAFGYSIAGQGNVMVAWAGAVYGLFQTPGIMLNLGFATSNGISWTSQAALDGTNSNSVNPGIAANYQVYTNPFNYHLVWEQVASSTSSKINYCKLYYQNNFIQHSTIEEPSLNSGYSKNYSPLAELRKVGNGENIYVTWMGYRSGQQDKSLDKGQSLSAGETRVLMKYKSSNWSVLGVYGNNVNNFGLNKAAAVSNVQMMGLAWSETSGSSFTNKLVKSPGLGTIITLNTTGKDLQINNSVDFNDMYANSFQSQSSPFNFTLSQNFGSVNKETALSIFNGREGVVAKDTAQFYFAVGDILLNGSSIDFVDIADTVSVDNLQMLNSYLISQPFTVNDNSTLSYGVQYGITDSASAVTALLDGSTIGFKVELIDDQTGEVLGSFDDVTYSPDNVFQYNNIGYDVDMTGIGSRTVRFKLIVNTDDDCEYSLSKRYADEGILGKSGKKQVKYQGTLAVTDYSLEQNYPNPFNPSTTIKYQLPQNGLVTLKIYDILGKEVVTLVNSEEQAGKYEVNFNASNLASGVYLYRIRVNDYVSTKKMLLIK